MIIEEDHLAHYGILRRSGRYPWGSGQTVYKRSKIFLDYLNEMKKEGLSESQIAEVVGMTVDDLRKTNTIAKNQKRQADISFAERLREKGMSNVAIGKRMDIGESQVRNLLKPGEKEKAAVLESTANMLKKRLTEQPWLDVGKAVESQIGVNSTTLDTAVAMLKSEGYMVHRVTVPQIGTGKETNMKVLALPGTTQKDAFLNRFNIEQIQSFTNDYGRSWYGIHTPLSIDPKRLEVVWAEDGGGQRDGIIYVRPGVKDIELGGSNYAQVRVMVGENKYLKGVAIYKDDLPAGTDLQFHTGKAKIDKDGKVNKKTDALKDTVDDPDNPFGSFINRQIVFDPGGPNERVTSAMNIVNEEVDWEKWSRNLSSQMLSKQSPKLAREQLDMTFEQKQIQFDSIMKLTNATVRKKLLLDFAGDTDSSAVHLKAASLPRQGVHVILPLSSISPTQVYAPNYRPGERVVLIRHPHGGKFEIPELTVNNRNAEGVRLLGPNNKAAIGIHHSVAQRMSGADFDGDTVVVISNEKGRVATSPALKELANFDPITAYPGHPGMKTMRNTQTEMGKISNLITDMSLKNAPTSEIARAIKHSMVVIDAEKHGLNHRLSYNDNNIKELKKKYQEGGASTLISRRKSELRMPQREPRKARYGGPIDPVTGELVYTPTGKVSYKTGKPLQTVSTKLTEARDARLLSSGTVMENIYADHSNRLKAMANEARRVAVNIPSAKYSPSARETYSKEVKSLNAKLAIVNKNKPLERQAQIGANKVIREKKAYNPKMDKDTERKIRFKALEEARSRTGAEKSKIEITPEEWDAIQAGAISDSKLTDILTYADMKIVHELAMPKDKPLMTSTMITRAKSMANSGYTRAEIAAHLGVSLTTLDTAVA